MPSKYITRLFAEEAAMFSAYTVRQALQRDNLSPTQWELIEELYERKYHELGKPGKVFAVKDYV